MEGGAFSKHGPGDQDEATKQMIQACGAEPRVQKRASGSRKCHNRTVVGYVHAGWSKEEDIVFIKVSKAWAKVSKKPTGRAGG